MKLHFFVFVVALAGTAIGQSDDCSTLNDLIKYGEIVSESTAPCLANPCKADSESITEVANCPSHCAVYVGGCYTKIVPMAKLLELYGDSSKVATGRSYGGPPSLYSYPPVILPPVFPPLAQCPKQFPENCGISQHDPNLYKLLEPPVNVPYCNRLPCSRSDPSLDTNSFQCHSQPGCYFDNGLAAIRRAAGHSVLPGVPVCHLAIRNKEFHRLANKYTTTNNKAWNGIFTNCFIQQNAEAIQRQPAGCYMVDVLLYIGIKPKRTGWLGITKTECSFIGGCYKSGIGCYYAAKLHNVQVRAGRDTYRPSTPSPRDIFGQPMCLPLSQHSSPQDFLSGYHYCRQSGCVLDSSINHQLIQSYLLNITASVVPDHLKHAFYNLVISGVIAPDNWQYYLKKLQAEYVPNPYNNNHVYPGYRPLSNLNPIIAYRLNVSNAGTATGRLYQTGGNVGYPPQTGTYPVYPPQTGGNPVYPPQTGGNPVYPPQTGGNPVYPPQTGGNPVYPPQTGGNPVYPPQTGGNPVYPPQTGDNPVYPPQTGGNPVYPPQTGGNPVYPPQTGGNPVYPPQTGGNPVYPPQTGGNPVYPPQTGGNPVYPPQIGGNLLYPPHGVPTYPNVPNYPPYNQYPQPPVYPPFYPTQPICPYRNFRLGSQYVLTGSFAGCCERHMCYINRNDVNNQYSGVAPYYAEWQMWSACSVSCGGGQRTRERRCVSFKKEQCPGDATQTQVCNPDACPFYGSWSNWGSCNAACGGGRQTRSRTCHPAGNGCTGDATQSRICREGACPTLSNWSEYSACNAHCGVGKYNRTRTCVDGGAYGCHTVTEPLVKISDCEIFCGDRVEVSSTPCVYPGCHVTKTYECRYLGGPGHCNNFVSQEVVRCHENYCQFLFGK